jgi:signal transduction histidine kinase
VILAVVCCLATTIVWAAVGAGPFWPMWVWLGLGMPLVLNLAVRRAWSQPDGSRRQLAVHGTVSSVLAVLVIAIWAMAGGGFFWPVFPLLVLAVAFRLHAAVHSPGPADLSARVDELTRTRRGVLDVQAAERRRIERDLHDGAQARLSR